MKNTKKVFLKWKIHKKRQKKIEHEKKQKKRKNTMKQKKRKISRKKRSKKDILSNAEEVTK